MSAAVARFLRSMVLLGVGLVIVGALVAIVREGALPVGSIPLADLDDGLVGLRGGALATAGILVLLATPPIALVRMGFGFARDGDRRFAAICAGLLGLVVLGLAAAALAGEGPGEDRMAPPSALLELGVLAAAAGSGALGVQVGLGGAAFLVPILSGFFAVPMKLAIGAGGISVVVNSIAGSSSYLRDRIPNIRLGLLLELPTLVGAIGGGLLVAIVAPDLLRGIFALVLLALALRVVTRPKEGHAARSDVDPLSLSGAYHDAATGGDVAYTPQRVGLGAWAGFVGGWLSGLLGLAGGVVKMPVMHTIMRMPVKAAAATSVLMGGITVSASAYIYYVHGIVDLSLVIPAVIGIQLGSLAGARMSRRLRGAVLERVLAMVLTGLGLVLVLQLFGIGQPAA